MIDSEIIEERPAPGVALLRLNRPKTMNALDHDLRKALAKRFAALDEDDEIRAVVMTGSEKAFVAGSDLNYLAELTPKDHLINNSAILWNTLDAFTKPLIAAVNGYALGGGCELAMHADIIIAGENSVFGQPEIRVGIMPGAGGLQRLARTIGRYKALKFVLTGERFSAREADRLGLVSELVADADVVPHALELAGKIAGMPPLAVRMVKEAYRAGENASLDAALLIERHAFRLLFDTDDQKEGMRAFLERRKPKFSGS
ncbi:MAG: enoyl-CoA hydratase-related protein [Pseudomonadota bacterium]